MVLLLPTATVATVAVSLPLHREPEDCVSCQGMSRFSIVNGNVVNCELLPHTVSLHCLTQAVIFFQG